jgi:hypothetical protein
MALTLDATLQAAQDGVYHCPLVEIVSAQRTADIPFDGTMLTSETFNEYGINMIAHSTGRLILAYIYDPSGFGVKFVYTDTARTAFTTVTLPLYSPGSEQIKSVSICEMTGGNIGMVLLVDDLANHLYRIVRRIYTPLGVVVSNAEIANWSHDSYTSDVWVQTLGANSYIIVYGKVSGSNYYLYKRTSSDFLTWAAEGQLTIGGLTATWRLSNPSIIKLSTGDYWLWFDALEATGPGGEELANIYYSVTADFSTMGAAVKVTAYNAYSATGSHPIAVQKAANQMNLIFTQKVGALHMEDTATGWATGDGAVELSWDSVNRKLYVINVWHGGGSKGLQCVVKIDVDTWTVDQYWDETTTPGFPSFICGGASATCHVWFANHHHDGHHIVLHCVNNSNRFIWHLDGEANTITSYYFDTVPALSVTANVGSLPSVDFTCIDHIHMDAAGNKIWLLMADTYVWHPKITIGYLDLTETTDYEYHEVVAYSTVDAYALSGMSYGWNGGFWYDADNGYLICTAGSIWGGYLLVFDAASGGLLYRWEGNGVDTDFPYFGLMMPFFYGGCVYAGLFAYTSGYGQSSYRGLVEVNLAAGTINYYRPPYCSDDDHELNRASHLQDGKIAMVHGSPTGGGSGYGVAVFDTISKTWELFSNDNIPGMTVDGLELSGNSQIVYDDVNDLIMVGDSGLDNFRGNNGIVMFSIHGFMRQAYYSIGTDPGSGWTFATPVQLVQGFRDYDAAAVVEPGSSTSMFVFWTSEDVDAAKSIKWDKDGSSLNLSAYLTGEIATERSISGKPSTLSFSVSDGHLFDPYNLSSLFNLYLKKGRKLTLRFGEEVGGTSYWQNQGTYFVTGASLSFKRGQYPVMAVEAEDQRALWAHSHIIATDAYSNLGEDIVEDLLLDVANMAAGDIALPAMGGSALTMQWVDTTLDEIISQVCSRLGYFFRFDVDGKAHARPITNAGSIDHTYTGNNDLLAYSPDDKYSDFTNQVTVMGQELDFTTVTFEEERIAKLSGTLGWWGCKKDHTVWFSDDKSRRCVNPRLEVLETAVTIPFELQGDVEEYLEPCDSAGDNKYCTVYAVAPDLTPQLALAIGMVGAGLALGDYAPPLGGMTIPIGKIIEKAGLIWALLILGSSANYQYEVWAQPLGSVRRSVQASWNDTEHQAEIDAVVPQVFTDPLCYSVADCQAVATFEGMVAQMQRKRVTITKVAHLQDEEGDTIRRVHPYSGQNIDLFIASIKRSYLKADPGSDNGYFLDEIEGWVVS